MQKADDFLKAQDGKTYHVGPRTGSEGAAPAESGVTGTLTFPTDSAVRFEPGAFIDCPELTHVELPDNVSGAPLNTVFDSHVTISDTACVTNTETILRPAVDKAIPLPLYVPPPQVRMRGLVDGILGIGVASGSEPNKLLEALDFPHTATFMPQPSFGTKNTITDVTDWFKKIYKSVAPVQLGGQYWVTERTIVLAMVRDGIVYDRFPLPVTVTMTSHLLNHIDAVDCVAMCNGVYSKPDNDINLGAYYAVF